MFGRRKRQARSAGREKAHDKATKPGITPLAVPGYGPAPVTRPPHGGPEPAPYGIPPDRPEIRPTDHRNAQPRRDRG